MTKHKKSVLIKTNELCSKGCGNKAKFKSPGGLFLCESSCNSCPAMKRKNSDGLKKAYKEGRKDCSQFDGKRDWSTGLTKETSEIVRLVATKNSQNHKIRIKMTSERSERYIYYCHLCRWQFGNNPAIIKNLLGFELLKEHGMYRRIQNTGGVVRDHRFSKFDGFNLNIPVYILSHPANCEFLLHVDNSRKTRKSSITLDDLLFEIDIWNRKFNAVVA